MNDKILKAVSRIEEAFGKEKMPPQVELDIQILDIWGADERVWNGQNYYFVGSRGSGKTTLVFKAKAQILDANKNKKVKALPCVLSCRTFLPPGEEVTRIHIRDFLQYLFGIMKVIVESMVGRNFLSQWYHDRDWDSKIQALVPQHEHAKEEQEFTRSSKIRLKLLTEIGSVGFSVLESGPLSIGSLKFTPIKIDMQRQEAQSSVIKVNVVRPDRQVRRALDKLIEKTSREVKRGEYGQIILFVDDLHLLPLPLQIEVTRELRYISTRLEDNGHVEMALKLFSGTDIFNDLTETLKLSSPKDFQQRHIEASLERLDGKRRAMENLLIRILRRDNEFTEAEIHEMLPREVIDEVLVLSGGHPRRFLEMCTKILERTQGVQGDNLHSVIMLSAAEVINSSRTGLIVQLGIEPDANGEQYKNWYNHIISELAEWSVGKNPFIIIPQFEMRHNLPLTQWINDAVAIGDLLEIDRDKEIEGQYFYLLAINPATVYDLTGKFEGTPLNYQDIAGLQRGLTRIE